MSSSHTPVQKVSRACSWQISTRPSWLPSLRVNLTLWALQVAADKIDSWLESYSYRHDTDCMVPTWTGSRSKLIVTSSIMDCTNTTAKISTGYTVSVWTYNVDEIRWNVFSIVIAIADFSIEIIASTLNWGYKIIDESAARTVSTHKSTYSLQCDCRLHFLVLAPNHHWHKLAPSFHSHTTLLCLQIHLVLQLNWHHHPRSASHLPNTFNRSPNLIRTKQSDMHIVKLTFVRL